MSPRVLRVGSRVRHIVFALALSSAFALSSAAGSAAASDESARVSPRIIGGTLAPAGTWPSLVALVASGGNPASGQFCGGTLIAKRWVLTAAHCLVDASGNAVPPGDQYVFAGQHDLTAPGEEIEVSRVLVNPNYDDTSTVNDIALLELTNASSQSVRPVIKPSQTDSWQPGDPALVAGWGGVVPQPVGCPGSPGCPPQTYSSDLREVQVAVVDDADCSAEYGSFFDSPSMLCAGIYPAGGKDACQGDSGSPLEVNTPAGRALIGVVSGGEGCGAANYMGIYNRTANYRTWIGNYAATVSGAPSPLGFGKVKVGRKRFKSVTLTGTSSLPATVAQYAVSGKGFKRAGGTCATTIETGASCKVKIRFKPGSKKKRSGYLTVTSAKGTVYRKVKLVGTGR